MTKKKIVHVIPSLNSGGAEKMLTNLVKYSNQNNYIHEIVTLTPAGFYEKEIKNMGINITSLSFKKSRLNVKSIMRLMKILKRADFIQSWMYHSDLIAFIIGKVFLRKKVIWGVRRSYLERELMKNSTFLIAKICSKLSKRVDIIVCNSETGKKAHVEFGYHDKRMVVIPNGFETDLYNGFAKNPVNIKENLSIKANQKVVTNIARWEPLKDHLTLLKAMSLVKEVDDNFVLLLCGAGINSENEELLSWIDKYNLKGNVILLGVRNDIKQILSITDVYVSSSISEGFPNVIGEAMASKVYCVATNAGDTELILGENGSIVSVGDSWSLSEKVIAVTALGKNELIKRGEQSRTRMIEEFSIESVVLKFEELYH